MQLRITEVLGRATDRYPYTHRIEFDDSTDLIHDQVRAWLDQLEIPAIVVIPYRDFAANGARTIAVYVNKQDVALFALKWS